MPQTSSRRSCCSSSRSILGNKQEAGKIYDKLFETKVVDALRSQIKVTEKSVSAEEFGKIAEATNAQ